MAATPSTPIKPRLFKIEVQSSDEESPLKPYLKRSRTLYDFDSQYSPTQRIPEATIVLVPSSPPPKPRSNGPSLDDSLEEDYQECLSQNRGLVGKVCTLEMAIEELKKENAKLKQENKKLRLEKDTEQASHLMTKVRLESAHQRLARIKFVFDN